MGLMNLPLQNLLMKERKARYKLEDAIRSSNPLEEKTETALCWQGSNFVSETFKLTN